MFLLSILHTAKAMNTSATRVTAVRMTSSVMTEAAVAVTRASAVRNTDNASEPFRPEKIPLPIK